ncbi:4-hydroxybenzoate transporter [Corticimicrobacter populi]|uniref:4-hydroxybenzoate transporter n=2 Tax=Corticimicrobacter populi TaxID=2175229 RepID=A0A2V1JVK6_9BURK|nr:4-hydroxybenzoate transporter [Corticimicrobacter populi]
MDIRQTVQQGAMSPFQVMAVSICVMISMIDGFDVLSVAFVGPTISHEWGLAPAQLGVLFSSGLAGMVVGSLVISPLADVFGRRRIILVCLAILASGMLASAWARGLEELAWLRVYTGLGMGGILAAINTVVAEFSSLWRRSLAISCMAVGYPIGAVLGGLMSVYLIEHIGWRSVFVSGGAASLLMLPLVWRCMPESLDFLLTRRPRNALVRLNDVLERMGLPAQDVLPPAPARQRPARLWDVFGPSLWRPTLLICGSYFALMVSFYFLLNWTPKILVSLGLPVGAGISGAVIMNLGGVAGGLWLGWQANRRGLGRLTAASLLAGFVCVAGFGWIAGPLPLLLALAALIGFFTNGSIVGLYALAPVVFPPEVRTTGTGLALGIGRLGATAGPYLAGLMIAAEWTRPAYYMALGAPLLLAAAGAWMLRGQR